MRIFGLRWFLGFLALFLVFSVPVHSDSGTSRAQPKFPYQLAVSTGMSAVPTGLTDLTTTDTMVYQVVVSNTTAGTITFLLQDKGGTPKQLIPSTQIPANGGLVLTLPEGLLMKSGLSWQAGGSGLQAAVTAFYK